MTKDGSSTIHHGSTMIHLHLGKLPFIFIKFTFYNQSVISITSYHKHARRTKIYADTPLKINYQYDQYCENK